MERRIALPNRIEPASQQFNAANRAFNDPSADSRANILPSSTRPITNSLSNQVRIEEFQVSEVKSIDGADSYKGSIKFVVQREGDVFGNPDPVQLKTIVKNAVGVNYCSSTKLTVTKSKESTEARLIFLDLTKNQAKKRPDYSRILRIRSSPSSLAIIRLCHHKINCFHSRESL